ncbi:MAG: ACP S-malonyltransferase [Spirochaetes bacterium]|nr:ACP S-malonyltransferase [Spirochaetota bacterium]
MKTCFLFPGQGAQYPGMAKDFYDTSTAVRRLFQAASDAAGMEMKTLLFESDEEVLKRTRNTQLSVALAGAAAALVAVEHGLSPSGFAGFSVGEWPALAGAGVISDFDLFRLVSERGRLMDKAGSVSGPATMSAVLFLSSEKVEMTIAESGLKQVWVANYNSPTQCVISGTEADVAAAEDKLKAAGARRVIRLKVSGAFHSPLMEPARLAFAESVIKVAFSNPKAEVFSNVTGKRILSGAQAKELALAQIVSSVRWIAEETSIAAAGFDRCIEVGPGSVLAGLWKASGSTIPCFAGSTLDDIASISL